MVEVDLRVNIRALRIDPREKNENPFEKDYSVYVTATIPKSKINDRKYIEYVIFNHHDLTQYVSDYDSLRTIEFISESLSRPVVRAEFFNKEK